MFQLNARVTLIFFVSISFTSENHAIMLWQPESCCSLRLYSFTLLNIFCTKKKVNKHKASDQEWVSLHTINQYKIKSCGNK